MSSVYERGLFTINSNLSDSGQPWKPPSPSEWKLKFLGDDVPLDFIPYLLTSGPLAKRAWCLQERHLSQRILHIFHDMTWIWECNTRVRGSNPGGLVDKSDTIIDGEWKSWQKLNLGFHEFDAWPGVLYAWDRVLVDYCKRSLTRRSDKLPAISGIVKKMAPKLERYDYGIWLDDIYGLMWHRDNFVDWLEIRSSQSHINTSGSEDGSSKTASTRIPSWSWAYIDSPILNLGDKNVTEQALYEKRSQKKYKKSQQNNVHPVLDRMSCRFMILRELEEDAKTTAPAVIIPADEILPSKKLKLYGHFL